MKQTTPFLVLLSFVFSISLFAEDNLLKTEERLFHIERSKNKNLVCYDINLKEGRPDKKNPLTIYWLNQEDKPGHTKELTLLQKKLAYGYKLMSHNEDSFEATLSASPERLLTICKEGSKYVCMIIINNEPAILQSLYVKAKESNSLSVEYVELRGITVSDRRPVSEKIYK